MLDGQTIAIVALIYVGGLFSIAYYGDRIARRPGRSNRKPLIYALTLGVYCTSWTFFGSVGLAAKEGLDFLPIYIGPILMLIAGGPLLRRIIRISKSQNITSIADFIAARYGKSESLAALVTVIAVIGTVPYVSLQLKAMSTSITTLMGPGSGAENYLPVDTAFLIAVLMVLFAILFGTRHIDTAEHQDGLMMAIAAESIIKLLAFLVVGSVVTFGALGGFGGLMETITKHPDISTLFVGGFDGGRWLSMTILSCFAIFLLPRQFHVGVVENSHEDDTRKAAWLFPLYLVAINLFVVPIAVAGLLTFPDGSVDADLFVLTLPIAMEQPAVTLIAFFGGLSAATAMVIVATIALAIMVSNNLVMPMILRRRLGLRERADMGTLLVSIRRAAIILILLIAYTYESMVGESFALASIGLISFAAIAQFAPAFFGGMFWRRATTKGATAGILAGFFMWAYTLLLPSFAASGWIDPAFLQSGPFGIAMLQPQHLFGLSVEPLTHGVIWSLMINLTAYVVVSLATRQEPIERLQAAMFSTGGFSAGIQNFGFGRAGISMAVLKQTVARYLGPARTERSFQDFAESHSIILDEHSDADFRTLRFAENLLARAVGAASSRLVMALMMSQGKTSTQSALSLLDDATEAIQYNRELLQSALDHVRQGLAVFDKDMRLVCWNRQFRHHLDLPADMGRVGALFHEIIRQIARGDETDSNLIDEKVSLWIDRIVGSMETFKHHLPSTGRVLELRTDAMPDSGLVLTVSDITENVRAAEELERANVTLESRVKERTLELTRLNRQYKYARKVAETANESKTRFLAAASHDILQPLNAARLYTTSLVERCNEDCEEHRLMEHIDTSLEAVEDILNTLLDIAKIDAGALKPDIAPVPLSELFGQLRVEFGALAAEKGLSLHIVPTSLAVMSNRLLLRRVLQNLLSNAVKYTEAGKVVMGCRRSGANIRIEVHDSGPGIPEDKHDLIFREFHRLADRGSGESGLGLGLSIVERIVKLLGHELNVRSVQNRGSTFILSAVRSEIIESQPPMPSPQIAQLQLDGLRVLCVDNEPEILEGMRTLLQGWGCQVETDPGLDAAGSPLAALADDNWPDILLMDYHLDQGTGLELIARIRQRMGAAVPAILITADRSTDLRRNAEAQGISVLNKPVKPAALRALMSRSSLARQAAQ
ncbi:MAG: hybrid sensor histidine kinase/response regulator [Hyphomicrobiales bacterium]|nr:MAG: hybrid sensor histidine kinase/response regulator [Hyphomicrobiales bacterium]